MTETMTNESVKLEPCPFCGGAAVLFKRQRLPHIAIEAAHGNNCPMLHTMNFVPMHETEAEAITAWNTRTAAQPEREVDLSEIRRAWNDRDGWKRRALRAEAALTTPAPAVSTEMEREDILFAQALGEVSAARRNVELANERLAIAEARLREAESAILTDICNQSAEALKPLGDSE